MAAGAVVLSAIAQAAPASADSGIYLSTNGTDAGRGYFQSTGEHFTVCDVKSDGYGVQLDWYVEANPSNNGTVRDGTGNDGACIGQNASIAEGKAVDYRLCLTNNGVLIQCTAYKRDFA
jgi:hypothetical protein